MAFSPPYHSTLPSINKTSSSSFLTILFSSIRCHPKKPSTPQWTHTPPAAAAVAQVVAGQSSRHLSDLQRNLFRNGEPRNTMEMMGKKVQLDSICPLSAPNVWCYSEVREKTRKWKWCSELKTDCWLEYLFKHFGRMESCIISWKLERPNFIVASAILQEILTQNSTRFAYLNLQRGDCPPHFPQSHCETRRE